MNTSYRFSFVFNLEYRGPFRAIMGQIPDHRLKINMNLYQRITPLIQAGPRLQFAVIAADAAGSPNQFPGLPLATGADTGSEQLGALDKFRRAEILSAYRTEPARRP